MPMLCLCLGYGLGNYTGKVARASSDREVTLTAKVTVPSNVSDGVKRDRRGYALSS